MGLRKKQPTASRPSSKCKRLEIPGNHPYDLLLVKTRPLREAHPTPSFRTEHHSRCRTRFFAKQRPCRTYTTEHDANDGQAVPTKMPKQLCLTLTRLTPGIKKRRPDCSGRLHPNINLFFNRYPLKIRFNLCPAATKHHATRVPIDRSIKSVGAGFRNGMRRRSPLKVTSRQMRWM